MPANDPFPADRPLFELVSTVIEDALPWPIGARRIPIRRRLSGIDVALWRFVIPLAGSRRNRAPWFAGTETPGIKASPIVGGCPAVAQVSLAGIQWSLTQPVVEIRG